MDEPLPELELKLREEEDELTSAANKMLVPELKAALADEGIDTTSLNKKLPLVERLVDMQRAAAAAAAARLRMRCTAQHREPVPEGFG